MDKRSERRASRDLLGEERGGEGRGGEGRGGEGRGGEGRGGEGRGGEGRGGEGRGGEGMGGEGRGGEGRGGEGVLAVSTCHWVLCYTVLQLPYFPGFPQVHFFECKWEKTANKAILQLALPQASCTP